MEWDINLNTKKKIKFNSIKFKTLGYLSLFSIFILLLFWELQMVFLDVLYEKYQIKDMNNMAKEIYAADSSSLRLLLNELVYNNSVCIEHLSSDGVSTLYNDKSTGCLLGKRNSILSEYKNELIESGEELKAIKFVNPDYESEALLYGIKVNKGEYVFLFSMLSDVNSNSMAIKGQLIYITLLVIIFAILISMFLSKMISKPIEQITAKSKQLANGEYNVVFDKNGILEIDELADTLNYLESEVSKTDEYRRDLMANVSHDLKTPLTMIKAYAEMIRDISYKDKEKMDKHLEVIISETDRLNILVGDILTLSKLQANADILNIDTFDLCEEVREILKKYEIMKETENYNFIVNMPEKALIRADKNKINQVIYNLINNAMNYTGNDKNVWINIIENKKDYLVEIKDSGKGIDKEHLEHIWERYYKHEKNHQRNVIGTGLGLSIVKNILESHDFEYGVKSIKNKGTTFYFKVKKNNLDK